ncbi:MAG: hypothetical protein RL681_522 [Candidatus Parcubacteria bacterium]|jgi:dolichyl-phosphate-mannose--protein O-mannosyl transferase
MMNRTDLLMLCAVFLVGFVVHVYRIGYPAAPVFDEAHFATYAADYAQGKPSFDIHPPLGKLLFAGVLRLSGYKAGTHDSFVQIVPLEGSKFLAEATRHSYGDFPFVLLRVVSALFGAVLPILFYFVLRHTGFGKLAAILGSCLVLLENALLVQTRFIFLDGMYLTFGFASLALYFFRSAPSPSRRGWRVPAWVSGAIWGLALGVKLTAFTVIGPVIADMFLGAEHERQIARRRAGIFAGVGVFVCAMTFVLGSAFVPPQEQRTVWNEFGVFDEAVPSVGANEPRPVAVLRNAGIQALVSLSGYIGGTNNRNDDPERTTRWYDWPFMRKPMTYYFGDGTSGGDVAFSGNRIVWGLSTVAVFVALFSALALFLRSAQGKVVHADRPMLLLGAGYLTSMLPFVFFVSRPTYSYHYLPGLLFAIGLAVWMLERELGLAHATTTASQRRWLIAIALVAAAGFLIAAPTTYGL